MIPPSRNPSATPRSKSLSHAAFILVFYSVLVIVWGAWVRISHSGDGCGDHWPLCNGQLLLHAAPKKTWIEYTHRFMSGLYGLFVIALWWKARTEVHLRTISRWLVFFMITEALLGAQLVLAHLVREDSSVARVFFIGLHFTNSLLLVATSVVFWRMSRETRNLREVLDSAKSTGGQWLRRPAALLVIGITGTWAALASTIFPGESLWEGLQRDFSPESHWLLHIRLIHPFLGLAAGLYAFWTLAHAGETRPETRFERMLLGTAVFGILTLFFLSPTWMKLGHLTLVHLTWIFLILKLTTAPRSRS